MGCREGDGGRSERGEVEGAAHASRLELARGAQLKVAVADDGVRLLTANLLLLALHVDLVLRLAAGGARADPLLDRLRLPAAAAGGFADGGGVAQRVGGELLGDGWAGRRRVRECLDAGRGVGAPGQRPLADGQGTDGAAVEWGGRETGACRGRRGARDRVTLPLNRGRALLASAGDACTVDLIVALVADAGYSDGRLLGLEGMDGDVAWGVEELEIGRVEESRCTSRAFGAEDAAALPAVL